MEGKRVLIIDGDGAFAEGVRGMLAGEIAGEFVMAGSLGEARRAAAEGECHGIILELDLPDSRGLGTLEAVVRSCPETPVVVLTGNSDRETARTAMKAGAQEYLLKERATRDALVRSLSNAIERKGLENIIRRNESRFHGMVENMRDVVFRCAIRPELGFEFVNRAVKELTGYPPAAFYADPGLLLRLTHPEDRHMVEDLLAGMGRWDRPVMVRIVRKDGRVVHSHVRLRVLRNAGGKLAAVEGVVREMPGDGRGPGPSRSRRRGRGRKTAPKAPVRGKG